MFTALGAPAGDHTNVRARYEITALESGTNGVPAYIGFCTVQESNTFSADFRIARSKDAADYRQKRQVCYASADCATADSVNPTQIVPNPADPDPSNPTLQPLKNIHSLMIEQPDFVDGKLVSPKYRGP